MQEHVCEARVAYAADKDVYCCPAGEALTYRYTTEGDGAEGAPYWTSDCLRKARRTTAKERRIT